jgi:hypothetical protein
MIPAPRYTFPAGLKASGPVSHPVNNQAHSAILHDIGAFFAHVAPSLVDRVGQPQGWPDPDSGNANPARSAAPFRICGDGSCPQNQESIMPATPSPLLQKAAAALSNIYFYDRYSSLRSAIDERLSLTTGLAEHLAESFDNAAHFRADLDFRNLYSAMTLLHRELQAIDALWGVMCEDAAPKATPPKTA